MPRRWARLPAILLLSLTPTFAAPAPPAAAGHALPVHWPRASTPFKVRLGNNLTTSPGGTGWRSLLREVSGDWSRSRVLDTRVAKGRAGRACSLTPRRVEACNGAYRATGWLGLAEILAVGEHILSARVLVNDSYFDAPAFDDPAAKRRVLCQEVGHALGLDHQPGLSCMNDRDDPFDTAYTRPDAHDYAELAALYAHADSARAAGPSGPASAASGEPPDRRAWGRPLNPGPDGRATLYLRERDDGSRLFTRIVWADPRP